MRRLLSLSFAILILFNMVGYSYVLTWCQDEIKRKAAELIDAHISEISGNLIFTVPVTVPYESTMKEYTRIDGEIQFEGVAYRMVKQKVQGNLLYIVCVNDDETRIATEEINEIIATTSGNPTSESTPSDANVLNSLLKYCNLSAGFENSSSAGWLRTIVFNEPGDNYFYTGRNSLFHPPSVI